jgi:acetyltransferase-like isoleucine patch superfamily enzyme
VKKNKGVGSLVTARRIDPSAIVSESAKVGLGCCIEAGVEIMGDAKLEDSVWLDSNVTIYGDVTIKESSYIGKGCIVGHPKRKDLMKMIKSRVKEAAFSGRSILGSRSTMRSGSIVYSDVAIGDNVELGHNVIIREQSSIGDNSLIGTNVVIDGETTVGKGVSIQTGVYICRRSTIEDFVFLGPYCLFTNDKYAMQRMTDLQGPIVKKGASIGANSTLMPGVTVGEGAVVGAHAVVTRNVPAGTMFLGVPARQVKRVPEGWRPLLEDRHRRATIR